MITLFWNGLYSPRGKVVESVQSKSTILAIAGSLINNKPMVIFISAYIFAGLSFGMWWGLLFIYLDSYLNLGNDIAIIFIVGDVVGFISIPLWLKLVVITSKSATAITGIALRIAICASFLLLEPGVGWVAPMAMVALMAMASACGNITSVSLLGDIADYGDLKFKGNNTAIYFATFILSFKITMGLGAGLALWIIGRFGFEVGADFQSAQAIAGLNIAFIYLPVILLAVSLFFFILTPINKARHSVICKRLERRSVWH